MDMSVALSSSEFSKQAQRTVSMAFALCESRLQAKGSQLSPELRALSAAALSLEKAVAVFIAAERLSK